VGIDGNLDGDLLAGLNDLHPRTIRNVLLGLLRSLLITASQLPHDLAGRVGTARLQCHQADGPTEHPGHQAGSQHAHGEFEGHHAPLSAADGARICCGRICGCGSKHHVSCANGIGVVQKKRFGWARPRWPTRTSDLIRAASRRPAR